MLREIIVVVLKDPLGQLSLLPVVARLHAEANNSSDFLGNDMAFGSKLLGQLQHLEWQHMMKIGSGK